MGRCYFEDWETGDFGAEWSKYYPGNTSDTCCGGDKHNDYDHYIEAASAYNGNYGLRCRGSRGYGCFHGSTKLDLSHAGCGCGDMNELWFGCWVKCDQTDGEHRIRFHTDDGRFIVIREATDGWDVLMADATNGTWSQFSCSTVASHGNSITITDWHYLEVHIKVDSVNGIVQTRIDGVLDIDFTGNVQPHTGTNIEEIDFYIMGCDGTYQMRVDDITIRDDGWVSDLGSVSPGYGYGSYGDPVIDLAATATPDPANAYGSGVAPTSYVGVDVTWVDSSEHEDGFVLQRKVDGGAWAEIATPAADDESYDDDIATGHTYTYRIKATSTILGDSEWSNEASVTV